MLINIHLNNHSLPCGPCCFSVSTAKPFLKAENRLFGKDEWNWPCGSDSEWVDFWHNEIPEVFNLSFWWGFSYFSFPISLDICHSINAFFIIKQIEIAFSTVEPSYIVLSLLHIFNKWLHVHFHVSNLAGGASLHGGLTQTWGQAQSRPVAVKYHKVMCIRLKVVTTVVTFQIS